MSSLADTLNPLERKVIALLKEPKGTAALEKESGLKDIEVMRALQWLGNKGLVSLMEKKQDQVFLGENGIAYQEKGLPERRALEMLKTRPLSTDRLIEQGITQDEINIIIGTLKRKTAIDVSKEGTVMMLTLTPHGHSLMETPWLEELFLKTAFPRNVESLTPEERFAVETLKARKDIVRIETRKTITASITPAGEKLLSQGLGNDDLQERLTPTMLKDGSWKGKRFRSYDLTSSVPRMDRGRRHFTNDAIRYAKRVLLDMGFQEMRGGHVQTAFWDLDALFVPQDHPAREMQDTFYLGQPRKGRIEPDILARVKAMHENGGETGSKGWQTPYDKEIAQRLLLRTHTTVLSAQTLAAIKRSDLPAKFFTIGKVYRNEAADWKHLFEFHQVEGIVVDPDANLKHLKGYLEEFYRKLGFDRVRMRPGHFPYTEPSIEPEVWHPVKKEWVEVGGAGIFRPEVTKTLLGEEIPVLAWGLGLERIITPHYGIQDLRELYNNDLKQLRRMKNFIT